MNYFFQRIYTILILCIYVYTYIYGANSPEMGWICDFVVFRKLFLVDLADSSDSLGSFFLGLSEYMVPMVSHG